MKKKMISIYIVLITAVIIFVVFLNITGDYYEYNEKEKNKIISEFKENYNLFEGIANELVVRNQQYIKIHNTSNKIYFGDGKGNVLENINENLLDYSQHYFKIGRYKTSEITMFDSNAIFFSYYYSSNNIVAYIVYVKNDVAETYYEKICDHWYIFDVGLV